MAYPPPSREDSEGPGGPPWMGLILFIALCFSAAGLGILFAYPAVETWYPQLRKPAWTPPNALFGPLWSVLYFMMAIAAWGVWYRGGPRNRGPLTLFGIQLSLNVIWSALFFGLKRPDLALVEIPLLWLAVGATVLSFARHLKWAAWLLLPYWVWVSFAAALNFQIHRLNPQ